MKKIRLYITLVIALALVHSSAQPVTRKTLEKAHTVTGIVSALGVPAARMISDTMRLHAAQEQIDAFDSMNDARINNANRAANNTNTQSTLVKLAPALFEPSHQIISAALEKDAALIARLVTYLVKIINAKTPPPANLQALQNAARLDWMDRRRQANRDFLQANADHLTKKENSFKSCSTEEAKAIAIEVAAAITHEILRFGLYKGVAKNFTGPDTRISRRAIRAIVHPLIIGLLELAKQKAATQWSPDSAHIYTPTKTALYSLLVMVITEICGEILCSQIEEITENIAIDSTPETITGHIAPQVS